MDGEGPSRIRVVADAQGARLPVRSIGLQAERGGVISTTQWFEESITIPYPSDYEDAIAFVITGYSNDPGGTDYPYEYIQLRATQDIDFSETPFTLVTSNSATASTPLGFTSLQGWATGDKRSYKFELTSGTVSKGEFFYVGGSGKTINGTSSTNIASANWIASVGYNATGHTSPAFYPGGPTGSATTNLLANSGNAFGIAVFKG